MASSTIYITIPAIINNIMGASIFSDIGILHDQITKSKAYSSGLITIGFGLGFLAIAITYRLFQNASSNPGAAKIHRLSCEKRFAEGYYFVFYCGLACIATLSFSHIVDGFDRYNSGATSAPIATILRSLKLESLTLYGFFFGLYSYSRRITRELRPIKSFAKPCQLPKARLSALLFELAAIMFLVLKTGSRSMIAGCLITVFIGHIVHKRLSLRSLTSALLTAAIILPFSINTFETIRIARSQSDFYKANPVHMAKRLASSAVVWPNMNSIFLNNRREEFNDIAFVPSKVCKKMLGDSELQLNNSEIERLRRCDSKVLDEYKESSPFLANGYFSKFIYLIGGGSNRVPQDWQTRFKEILGRIPESTSAGESINLSGDLFLRGNLVFAFMGGIFLGFSYCCLSLAMGFLIRGLNNEITQSFMYTVPLGLTSGSLFLPIDGQLWLLATQLPKAILVCFILGWTGDSLRQAALNRNSRTKRLSR